MRLNYDCVRDVLLDLEDMLQFNEELEYPVINLDDICNELESYSKQEIAYTLINLSEANYIVAQICDGDDILVDILCTRITFEGHKYLDSIRTPQIWAEIKQTFKSKAINLSLDWILTLAKAAAESRLLQ